MLSYFSENFNKTFKNLNIKKGSLLKGIVTFINKEFIFIDVNLKSESAIPIEEFKDKNKKIKIKIGDKIDVVLEAIDNGYGETILSREKAKINKIWFFLNNALKNNKSMFGYITGKTKGGFSVKLGNTKAFLPGSLVDVRPIKDITYLEGKKLEFKIIKLDKKRNNIVISRKSVIESKNINKKKKILNKIKIGMYVKGIVKNLTDYGAFINIGGLDGLLHITDMSWKRIKHPNSIVNIGDELILKVIKFNNFNKRISLGLKQRFEDPWINIIKRYPKGYITKGRVSNLTDYGCFVEIEEGIEGLVHNSEMDWSKKNINPYNFIKLNKKISIMILNIDIKKRRISLGVKQCKINPWKNFCKKNTKGKILKGRVKSITNFGIFIKLSNGIDGLIHISDVSWNLSNKESLNKYYKGDIINSIILKIDKNRERVSLGIKQISNFSFNKFLTIFKKNNFIYSKIILLKYNLIKLYFYKNLFGYLKINKNNYKIIFKKNKIIKVKLFKINKNKKKIILSI